VASHKKPKKNLRSKVQKKIRHLLDQKRPLNAEQVEHLDGKVKKKNNLEKNKKT